MKVFFCILLYGILLIFAKEPKLTQSWIGIIPIYAVVQSDKHHAVLNNVSLGMIFGCQASQLWHATTYVIHTVLAPVLGLPQNLIEVAEAEKLFTSSLLKLESIWLKGEGNFLLGSFRPSIADISLVCEIMQFEVLKLRGAVVYFDGQMDDSCLNVAIACTAALAGASVLNHVEVVSLHKDKISGRVIGAHIRDHLTDEEFDVYAKVIVNAAGPFSDILRKMENNGATNIISPNSGAHVVLPDYFTPKDMGLIIPKTKDAHVVFILPWGGKTLVGTIILALS
ncbi:hypothetical protein IFM89_003070 [Coptis chinensis]|uniref:glycerol-3-phosphate dehydrogenase n=1 Tax=Coptis chinensis TaxID=261450 RepID=A0A835IB39_9MAGN|nr:hypothetical protein IFM89_003070 [Coptis chinensis]